MIDTVVWIALLMMVASVVLTIVRILLGPNISDRILGLDTLYVNTTALLVLLSIYFENPSYFESALLIAVIGFVSTIALCKYLLRGDIIE